MHRAAVSLHVGEYSSLGEYSIVVGETADGVIFECVPFCSILHF